MKISPTIEFDKQVFYLKEAKETDSQATIVSEEHTSSPFGLIIHSNAPVPKGRRKGPSTCFCKTLGS